MEKTKKEKEASRNRGTTESEEEQRSVMETVCRKDKTKTEEKSVLFAQRNTEKVRNDRAHLTLPLR